MVAYTDSLGFYKNSAGFAANYTDRVSVIEIDIDFAKIAAARAAASAAALGATDTLVIGTLPKGAYVVASSVTVVRAEGAVATADIGVAVTHALWGNDVDLNAAVGTTVGLTTAAYYAAADTDVLLTVNTAATDAARIKVSLAVVNMGADLGTIANVT